MAGGPLARLKASFAASIGDVVFGMEDGAVSIFGLVFGMATAAETSADVLLAGATGAAAAAVSMMAGVWLDARSERDRERALARRYAQMVASDPDRCAGEIAARLRAVGMPAGAVSGVMAAARQGPGGLAALAVALRGGGDGGAGARSPTAHALWMFVADLLAGAVPVLPFAFLPLDQARWVSVLITAVLLVALGFGRSMVSERGPFQAVAETVGVASAAALAGLAIGQLINRLF
jgi:VIT1/CCC1 family predicted Fe2+/Mn2+ transporter